MIASIVRSKSNLYSLALTREVVIRIFGDVGGVSDEIIELVYNHICSMDYDIYDEYLLEDITCKIKGEFDISGEI